MRRRSTTQEVEDLFLKQGYEVHIDTDGRVYFRDADIIAKHGRAAWLTGRWVDEYLTEDDGTVHLR